MDSPESTTEGDKTAVNATDATFNSPQAQESPFMKFANSLSPLDFKSVPRMSQGFWGLGSSYPVFGTPRANPDRDSSFLRRPQNIQQSTAETSQEDARLIKVPQEAIDWDELCLGMQETSAFNYCQQIQDSSSSEQVDKYLADSVEGQCSEYSVDQNLKEPEAGFQMSPSISNTEASFQGVTLEPENVEQAEDDGFNVLPKPSDLELKSQVSLGELKHDQCVSALNIIVKVVPLGHDATVSLKLTDGSMSMQDIKSEATVDCHFLGNKTRVETSDSPICESLETFEAVKLTQTIKEHATLHDKRMFSMEHPDNFENHIDQNPKYKKKKMPNDPDDDGWKQCNCKKSKCLKLYCDCFGDGMYCIDTCSCQGCLNRVEHVETVLETRRQIESRNSLAFAPKIIQHGSEFLKNTGEDQNIKTPASARHKRGCNCKNSMCTKKYCPCNQNNVGCSSGCQCKNCKNCFGKKDDCVAEELTSNRAVLEKPKFDDNMHITVTKNDSGQAHMGNNMHRLTVITSSLQYSDHGKGGPKSQFIRFHPYLSTIQRNSNDRIPKEDSQTGSMIDGSNITPLCPDPLTTVPTSASFVSSLRSPISKNSPEYPDSDTELLRILLADDEIQELLKQTPTKVRSSSQKRVSPLQQQQVRNVRSGLLRSGQKLVLRGVPSFPPLTPCTESKTLEKQQEEATDESKQSSDKL